MEPHKFRCQSCGGTYADLLPNGSIYMHVCGPMTRDAKRKLVPTANPRNENVVVGDDGRTTGIVSAGAGVTCLSDGRLEEPPWISALYKRIEQQEAKERG